MSTQIQKDEPTDDFTPGSRHYRAFIGPNHHYDLVSAMQFNLLTFLGLRENHLLLDIGCGSLRAGKLFIPYLLEGHYCGIEPEPWLLEEGINKEVGQDLIAIKKPTFIHDRNFLLSAFNRTFDYLLAQSIFSHTSQAQLKQCLAEARKVMKPSSIFAATFLKGTTNYTGDEWVYPECIPYTEEFMVTLVEGQGFICKPIPWTHPNNQTWMIIVRNDYDGNALELVKQMPFMRAELDAYKKRLALLEGHPYVRIGMAIKALLRNVKKSGN